MKTWQEIKYYAGFDWARNHHLVVIVDTQGTIVTHFEFPHSCEGWQSFRQKTQGLEPLAVAIETNQGAAVDQLLQYDYPVYPVNPAAAAQYRKRKAPSGTKTDYVDGWSLADALRVDGHGWKVLAPLDELSQALRLLCRDEVAFIEQRTALVNQLQQALVEYYPAALAAFEDWTSPAMWEFIVRFPTPEALVRAGRRRWEKFLHTHRLWRSETLEKRLAIFAQANQMKIPVAVTQAKSRCAVSLCQLLRTLEHQLAIYRQQIDALFQQHPDHDRFGSLPGAGEKLAPRLLAAISADAHRWPTVAVLQMVAGTAPISFISGQLRKTKIRWACDKFLRHTLHLWANSFRCASAWGQTYYQHKRDEGKSHACALRCLGQRLLKIVFRMIADKRPYDAELHARNQQRHGSWVLKLAEKKTAQTCE